MAWYKPFWSKNESSETPLETKNHITPPVELSFAEFLMVNGHSDLGFARIIQLYKQILPFQNAVDIRARALSDTPTRLKDKEGKLVKSHPMLDLINKPNDAETSRQFKYALASTYDMLGNVFVLATGDVDRKPHELIVIQPHKVTANGIDSRFGWLNIPASFYVRNEGYAGDRFFAEDSEHGIRYINNLRDKELIPMIGFNPLSNSANYFGMSKAQPSLYEMEQYLEGNINNKSNLVRGARPSMIWQNNRPEMLTQEQWDRAKEMSQKYSGSKNAGGIPLLDGLEAKPISSSNNEMQFRDLQKDMFERINVCYDIPLPMVTSTANTFNNYETAQVSLWDNAIMPLGGVLNEHLTKALAPRFDAEGYHYAIDEADVEPLRKRTIETAKIQNEINVNSIDEIRELINYAPYPKVGGDIYAPLNIMPLGSGAMVIGDPDANNPANQAADKDRDAAAKKFRLLLSEMKTEDGARKYTDNEIEVLVADNYG